MTDEGREESMLKKQVLKTRHYKVQATEFWENNFNDKDDVSASDFKSKLTEFLYEQEKKDENKYANEYPDNFVNDVVDRFFLQDGESESVNQRCLECVLNGFGADLNLVFQIINDNFFIPHPNVKFKLFEIFHGHDESDIIQEALGTQKDGGGWFCLRYPDSDDQGGIVLTYNKQSKTKRISFQDVRLKYVKIKNKSSRKWKTEISVPAKLTTVDKKLFFENLGDFIQKMTELGKISKPCIHQFSSEVLGSPISQEESKEKFIAKA